MSNQDTKMNDSINRVTYLLPGKCALSPKIGHYRVTTKKIHFTILNLRRKLLTQKKRGKKNIYIYMTHWRKFSNSLLHLISSQISIKFDVNPYSNIIHLWHGSWED